MSESYLRRAVARPGVNGAAGSLDAGEWSSSFPALAEFLGAFTWPDGTQRQTGSLTLFVDEFAWKLCLSDRDQSLVAFVSGTSPLSAFQAAERGLVAGSLDWRPQGRGSQKKR